MSIYASKLVTRERKNVLDFVLCDATGFIANIDGESRRKMPFVKCAMRSRGRERKVQKIIICVDVCVCERECVCFQELMNEGVEES